jgi:ABC-type cobalamin/Fe3+-siderophores transport system ATPase subunit
MTGVEPAVFGGRTKELEFFEHKLNRTLNTKFAEHFLVLGDWGIGKSTLLKEI